MYEILFYIRFYLINIDFITDHTGEPSRLNSAGSIGPQHYCRWWGHFRTTCICWSSSNNSCRITCSHSSSGELILQHKLMEQNMNEYLIIMQNFPYFSSNIYISFRLGVPVDVLMVLHSPCHPMVTMLL